MNDHDRRESGRLMLISPERVFYAGLLGRPRRRTSGGHNIYVAMAGQLRITEDRSEVAGEVAMISPYSTHSVESDHPCIISLVIEPETVEPAAMAVLSARMSGPEAPGFARRIRDVYETLRRGERRGGFTTGDFDQLCFGENLPDRNIDARIRSRGGQAQRFLRRQTDCGRLRRIGRPVAVALPASVQGADRHVVPRLPGLETRAAFAALRQSGSQPRASGAGNRLSRTRPISAIRSAGSMD